MDINYFSFFYDNKSGWKTVEKKLSQKEPNIYLLVKNYVTLHNLNELPFKQQVWHFINKYPDIPKCLECNVDLKFKKTIKEGYGKYCTIKCTNKNINHKNSVKLTNNQKYGTDSPIQNPEIMVKIKKTNQLKYGVDNPFERLDLVSNGFMRKYGVNHVSKVNGVSEKRKNTNKNKYGYDNNLNNPNILKTSHNTRRGFFLEKYKNFNFVNHSGNTLTLMCDICGCEYEISRSLFRSRVLYNIMTCTKCNEVNKQISFFENELYNFIVDLVGVDSVIKQDRTVLNGKELDIYIPKYNLAIEFNGLYWHSDKFVNKNYHKDKFNSCYQSGVKLIHVFEDEWVNNKNIVKSIITNVLGITPTKIYARNCTVVKINNFTYKDFLKKNHIQGSCNAKIKLGLYYNQDLVSVMSFGGLRKSLGSKTRDDVYEMLRFCNKLNTNVIGGASKLFKFFLKTNEVKEVISFSDNRWFNGDLYGKLGFTFSKNTTPNYFYMKEYLLRENRFKYRKDILVKNGHDKNKTEFQIMDELGYLRIWDCGSKKWVMSLE